MTFTLERGARTATPKNMSLGQGLPQVNLLPPEVRAARALSGTKRRLALVLVVVFLLVAVAYAGALMQAGAAKGELTKAQEQTAELTAQQAQYAEVPVVLGRLDELESARELGFSTEIPWSPYVKAVLATMPEGVLLSNINVTSATPMLAPAAPLDPLQAPSVSRVDFMARSTTLVASGAWIDALNSIPGFADAWVSSVAVAEDETYGPHYEVTASVQVDESAYTNRFVIEEGR
ncbi:fimbrial assembly protein [Cellulomonas fimi]|uniref:Fimbrial assembly protein n=1 Tax=Cellulomonas fimi TaxID=1708 RepID=A0A7Y0LYC6_CELFI|nr:fimbrial assembly protein [Cellulomonas fimi]NMR20165.1 fimbrial assembly protein [Cellulomonas fimi]